MSIPLLKRALGTSTLMGVALACMFANGKSLAVLALSYAVILVLQWEYRRIYKNAKRGGA